MTAINNARTAGGAAVRPRATVRPRPVFDRWTTRPVTTPVDYSISVTATPDWKIRSMQIFSLLIRCW